MTDVFEVLEADHAEVKQILTALQESPGASQGASSTGCPRAILSSTA